VRRPRTTCATRPSCCRCGGSPEGAAEDLPARLQALVDGQRKVERELSDARKALALAGGGGAAQQADEVRDIGGVKLIGRVLNGVPARN
jgi:alanyl-tRNA synthetase